jgi:hypothetical protein
MVDNAINISKIVAICGKKERNKAKIANSRYFSGLLGDKKTNLVRIRG